ncbi:MAG: hypothetical protein ACRDXX_12175 [Stackebrandtia sp.]
MYRRHVRLGIAALSLTGLLAVSACKDDEATPADDQPTTESASPSEEAEPSEEGPAPESVEAAIARFEDFLHALGGEDLDTVCEIAAPAAKIAEDEGFGPCEDTYGIVLGMISDEEAAALETATVDQTLVEHRDDGTVFVPVDAVVSDVQFSEENLGSYTLEYQENDWFIVE